MRFSSNKMASALLIALVVLFGGCLGAAKDGSTQTTEEVVEVASAVVEQSAPQESVPVPVAAVETKSADSIFEPNLLLEKEMFHPPYEWGDCTVCHTSSDPEGSGDTATIMDPPDLCYMCHDKDLKEGKKFIHGPVAAGACTACHNPHKSPNKRLLVMSNINELCTMCHQAKGEFLHETQNIHPPVKDQCTNCHDPHTEDYKFQLRADGKKDLCVMCHVDKKERIENSKYKHGAIDRPNGCQECHDPHGTGQPRMLKADSIINMCLKCHDRTLKTDEDGYELLNIKKHLDENPDWHGPIQWGDCAMCHNPHGSDNLRMLKKPFPKNFYEKFDVKNYICFECHDSKKITAANTVDDTNFRNGTKNMHFVHVNKKKGRTCRACHDFHGTKDYPHHLRKKTQFGKISFPIRFIETPTGGSCAPACHARRYYDRENPVVNTK